MPPLPCTRAPSAAKLFVQLCARSPRSSVLSDVLLPLPAGTQTYYGQAHRRALSNSSSVPIPPSRNAAAAPTMTRKTSITMTRAATAAAAQSRLLLEGRRRAFSTSRPLALKTVAIHNPRKDEDGKEMVLEITEQAASRLTDIMTKDKNQYLALRIQVESGGCHGFQYIMSLTTLPPITGSSATTSSLTADEVTEAVTPSTTTSNTPSPSALGEDDTILAYSSSPEQDDATPEKVPITSPKIVLDLPSLELLKGSKVDYVSELIGSQFKIIDNPLATSSCGCGTSFDIKI